MGSRGVQTRPYVHMPSMGGNGGCGDHLGKKDGGEERHVGGCNDAGSEQGNEEGGCARRQRDAATQRASPCSGELASHVGMCEEV